MATALQEIYLRQLLETRLQSVISGIVMHPVAGGSINNTSKITVNGHLHFFLKSNSATRFPNLFIKERNGLQFLCDQHIIQTPGVVDCSEKNNEQYLLLEWIEQGNKTTRFWKTFGEQLAQLHRVSNEQFGFAENNFMGALPQVNTLTANRDDFFIQCRLQPQVKMAFEKQLLYQQTVSSFERLYKKLSDIFTGEKPSLLHGDLWGGNFLCTKDEKPVLIDPAVYFGDRNSDLAMTTLFGGFDPAFYESYNYHFALPHNYKEQWTVYNLYPLLVHLNLFGISYLQDIELILKKFSG